MNAKDTSEVEVEPDEYRWTLFAAVVLSMATLASAWCGFQAAGWGSAYSQHTRASNGERFEAARQSDVANRQLSSDLMIFSTWLEAEVRGDAALASEVQARFRPHFRPAFDAWRQGAVPAGARLPQGSPFDQAQYVLPTQAAADLANARAQTALDAADVASNASARYVLASVLFASVLFLAGIASRLADPQVSHAVVVVAAIALLGALWFMLSSPMRL